MKIIETLIALIFVVIFIVCFLIWFKVQTNKIATRISIRSNEWKEKIQIPFNNWFYPLFDLAMTLEPHYWLIATLLSKKIMDSHSYYLSNKDLEIDIKDVLSKDEINMMNKISPFTL